MKTLLAVLLVTVLLIQATSALDCYVCSKALTTAAYCHVTQSCATGEKCGKTKTTESGKDYVTRTCASETTCKQDATECCDSNVCNSGVARMPSSILLTVVSVFGLIAVYLRK